MLDTLLAMTESDVIAHADARSELLPPSSQSGVRTGRREGRPERSGPQASDLTPAPGESIVVVQRAE